MPQYRAPIRDMRFALYEFLNINQYQGIVKGFEDLSVVDPVIEAGAQYAEEILFPLNQVGDKEGLKFDNGNVTLPTGFKDAYKAYVDSGWASLACDPAYGGQGLPNVVNTAFVEMICSANLSFGLIPGLTHGAYSALHIFGTDSQKQRFLPKMVSGVWTGVMCLTEPHSGTDLGLITTRAESNGDGTYKINGTKIFISCGEHDASENIVHLILARLPDAPAGVKGISLFVASKFMVDDSGNMGVKNSISCGSIEHKMGIHASPTCVMNYDNAIGELVGEPHKGLKAMFTMMNEARLLVGIQGLGVGEVSYQNALEYSRERLQGRSLKGAVKPEKKADPLYVHPDIRRMLLTMRSFTEGGRILAMWAELNVDLAHNHPDATVRAEADEFVQLITPIVKAYLTEYGTICANLGVQIYGGHGYIREHGMEQYARDARIAEIYEGTNSIQALDLVGRKLGMNTGKLLRRFFHPVTAFIDSQKSNEKMAEFTKPLYMAVKNLQDASLWIGQMALGNPDEGAGAAMDYLRMFSLTVLGYIWAKSASIALQKLEEGTEEKTFYEAKLATARFFINKILPEHYSLLAKLTSGVKHLDIPDIEAA
jgi:alkylation response protein AidB-like acyl-CoA dehydrogenase